MALANYTDLLTAMGSWEDDTDLATNQGPDFIRLTEQAVNFGFKDEIRGLDIPAIRSRRMETRAAITIDGEYETLPTDFLEPVTIRLTSTTPIAQLKFFPEQDFNVRYFASTSGQPKAFTITGDSYRFGPSPEASYTGEQVYLAQVPALTSLATTNWLMTYHPDVYLYGCRLQMALFTENAEGISHWGPMFAGAVKGVNRATLKGRFSGPLVMQSDVTKG